MFKLISGCGAVGHRRTAGVKTASGSLQGSPLLKTCFQRRGDGVAEGDREDLTAQLRM